MFRRIWKWTQGESILAEAVGAVANRISGGFIAKDRNFADVVDKIIDGESFL